VIVEGAAMGWRIDPQADYGEFNDMSRHKINLPLIASELGRFSGLAGSLKLGRVPASDIMRMMQISDTRMHPIDLAKDILSRISRTRGVSSRHR
jgi:hypothetical protein